MRDPHFNLKKRIHDWYRNQSKSLQEIAFEMGKDPQTLSNEISEWSPNKHEVWDLMDAMEITGDYEPLDMLNAYFKRITVDVNSNVKQTDEEIVVGMADTLATLGKVGEHIRDAMRPESKGGKRITKDEWNEIVASAYCHAGKLLTFVYSLYQNNKKGDVNGG